jgi:hypothetical protein
VYLAGGRFPGAHGLGAGLAEVVVALAAAFKQGGRPAREALGAAGASEAVVGHFEQLEAVAGRRIG